MFLWLVELCFVSLKGSAISSSVFWGFSGLVMALGSLSDHGQVCVPILLKVLLEVSGSEDCLLLSKAWS